VRAADGLILGPAATFDFKDEQSGEINPSKIFPQKPRSVCQCAAGAKPIRACPTGSGRLTLWWCGRNTEGFLRDRNMEQGNSELLVTPDVVISLSPHHEALLRANCAGGVSVGDEKAASTSPSFNKANVLKNRRRHVSRHLPEAARALSRPGRR